MSEGQEPEVITVDQVDAPNLHEVNPSAVAAAQSKESAAAPGQPEAADLSKQSPASALPAGALWPDGKPRIDRNGRAYDPKLHALNLDGSVATRRDGRLAIRKDARGESMRASVLPPLEQPAGAAPAGDIPPGENVPPPPEPVNYGEVARGIVDPLLGAVTVVLGADEWSFPKAERDQYVNVVEQLAMKYNIAAGFPPEVQLAQLMIASVAARADKPKTAKLIVRARDWIVRTFSRRSKIAKAGDQKPEPPRDVSDGAAVSEGGRPLASVHPIAVHTNPAPAPGEAT